MSDQTSSTSKTPSSSFEEVYEVQTKRIEQLERELAEARRDDVDTGAIAWALKKLHAFGVTQNNQENAMMADRLEAMLRAATGKESKHDNRS